MYPSVSARRPRPSSTRSNNRGMTPTPDISAWEIVRIATGIVAIFVTLAGVLVALWISGRAARERRRERREDQEYEARMFRVLGTGESSGQPPEESGQVGQFYKFHFYVEHHGPHPVFDIHYEAWMGEEPLTDRPALAAVNHVGLPMGSPQAESLELHALTNVPAVEPLRLRAWRVRWTDRYGNDWVADKDNLPSQVPRRFSPWETPRPYSR